MTELESAKKLEDYNSKTDESKLMMLNETKKRESRLAELEDKINDMTELCSQLEREKVIEMEKNIASQRIIEQVSHFNILGILWIAASIRCSDQNGGKNIYFSFVTKLIIQIMKWNGMEMIILNFICAPKKKQNRYFISFLMN